MLAVSSLMFITDVHFQTGSIIRMLISIVLIWYKSIFIAQIFFGGGVEGGEENKKYYVRVLIKGSCKEVYYPKFSKDLFNMLNPRFI